MSAYIAAPGNNGSMRLATWNCQTGLGENWAAVEALNADVLTIQECGSHTAEQAAERGWTCEWKKSGSYKGLAVLARPPYEIETLELSEPFVVSTVISGGSKRFRFVGFWAMSPTFAGDKYPQQAIRLIDQLPDDDLPTVVAGDFNASKGAQHLKNVERLRALGLVSAFHSKHGVEHSAVELEHTSYFQWKELEPHHMDFVFVPTTWNVGSVEVGTFDAYSRPGGMSDHVPVVVSIGQN
jgi:endonuclease/exonuclease/phosphatase family metal-dependent hydrolase